MTTATAPQTSLAAFAVRLRRGEITAEAATRECLARIDAQDGHLQAFTHVAREQAITAARAIDHLLAAGTDLGPLMGVPIAVKDLFTVRGMPSTAGSNMPVSELVPPEGPIIGRLKRAGCVILGKTRTSEFALGAMNFIHPLPKNPADPHVHRMPGGSSSGSAVAQAAGLCRLALGTDTGGSVRMPAALCGVVGHKFSAGLLPIDGIFPLSPTLDSPGVFAASARDALETALVLTGSAPPRPVALAGLRLGVPGPLFYEDLDPAIDQAMRTALARLNAAGVITVPIELGPPEPWVSTFAGIVPVELVAILGRDRIAAHEQALDPVARARITGALAQDAVDYLQALASRSALERRAEQASDGIDAWILPTSPTLALPVADCRSVDDAIRWNGRALRNTRPGNLFGQCAVSLPLPMPAGTLPAGLQLAAPSGEDIRLLALACAVESTLQTA